MQRLTRHFAMSLAQMMRETPALQRSVWRPMNIAIPLQAMPDRPARLRLDDGRSCSKLALEVPALFSFLFNAAPLFLSLFGLRDLLGFPSNLTRQFLCFCP